MKFIEKKVPNYYIEDKININNWSKYIRKIRETLIIEFNCRCAYCESNLNVTSLPNIDNFYPKSKYPKEAFLWENLLLCCQVCNINKANYFPLDENNNPLLINPCIEDPNVHIELNPKSGLYDGKTQKGNITITTLGLNRKELIIIRKRNLNLENINSKFSNVIITLDRSSIFENFEENISKVLTINESLNFDDNNNKLIAHMLYANIITVLETYLADIFINTIFQNTMYLRKFVETYPKYNPKNEKNSENIQKFPLYKVFEYYDKISEIVTDEILRIIYHNLKTIKPMFKDTFGVEFPNKMGEIYRAITIRHDIIHRNGKTKIDKETKSYEEHTIDKFKIAELASIVRVFITNVDEQMMKL